MEYTINRMKRQAMGQEKIFTDYVSNKELVSRIYKVPQNSTIRK